MNKKIILLISLMFLLVTTFNLAEEQKKEILYWTCGMHPSVRISPEAYKNGSTKCPICKMDLIPVYKGGKKKESEEISIDLSELEQKLAGVQIAEAKYLPLYHTIRTVGKIDYDERHIQIISAWIPGRIEKLYASYTGVEVKKGAPLVKIYSPKLITAQQEYLLALESNHKIKNSPIIEISESVSDLVESAKRKLLLLGLTEKQIKELERTKKIRTYVKIYSPQSGIVIEKYVYEGKYVKEGEPLYKIADLKKLWIWADVYEFEVPWIKMGQVAKIKSVAFPKENFSAKVNFIEPYLNEKTRTIKVRFELDNRDLKLKPGMYVDVIIKSYLSGTSHSYYTCPMHPEIIKDKPGNCPICGMELELKSGNLVLAIPKTALLDLGPRKIVYVKKDKNTFVQKEVEIGSEGEVEINGKTQRFFQVIKGLQEGDKVVVNANFLIDSQTQLSGEASGAYGGALEADNKPSTTHKHK